MNMLILSQGMREVGVHRGAQGRAGVDRHAQGCTPGEHQGRTMDAADVHRDAPGVHRGAQGVDKDLPRITQGGRREL